MTKVQEIRKEKIPLHRILREVCRHYLEFRDLFINTGESVFNHGYFVENEDGVKERVMVSISFWDLQDALKDVAPRKREAMFYNVILDKRQEDVAKIMGITAVSVGQYVEAACIQLAKNYFTELEHHESSSE
jgi:DNA-directed RNA polymerase specialized sigma24 family protein